MFAPICISSSRLKRGELIVTGVYRALFDCQKASIVKHVVKTTIKLIRLIVILILPVTYLYPHIFKKKFAFKTHGGKLVDKNAPS